MKSVKAAMNSWKNVFPVRYNGLTVLFHLSLLPGRKHKIIFKDKFLQNVSQFQSTDKDNYYKSFFV